MAAITTIMTTEAAPHSAVPSSAGPTSNAALLRLMTWLSPAFPVGGFAYSGGLEQAIADRHLTSVDDLSAWLTTLIGEGVLWNDAVLLAEAHRLAFAGQSLAPLAELAAALAGSAERYQETTLLGQAFLAASVSWQKDPSRVWPDPCPYPVAVGGLAGADGIGCVETLQAYLHAAVAQILSAAIRLSLCGQSSAVALQSALEVLILQTAARAAGSSLDDLGTAAILGDIASLRHESLTVRLFRS